MYTILAINRDGTAPGGAWRRVPWAEYGFDAQIRFGDAAHIREAVLAHKPDAVFLDVDGLTDMASWVGAVTQGPHPCLCIVLSGRAEHDHIRKAMRAGAFDFCAKPVNRDSLMEIADALRARLDERAKGPAVQDGRLPQIRAYIEAHLHEKIALPDVARAANMSKNYLCYYFKQHMGVTFVEYLSSVRIKRAKSLLAQPMTLDEIAEQTGFSDTPYFIKVFKKYEGVSPGAYRKTLYESLPRMRKAARDNEKQAE
jgi:two-component system response regulator YesN